MPIAVNVSLTSIRNLLTAEKLSLFVREVLPVGQFLDRFLCTNSMQRVGCVWLYLWIESVLLAWKTLRFSVKCKKNNHSIKIPLLFSKLCTDDLQFKKFYLQNIIIWIIWPSNHYFSHQKYFDDTFMLPIKYIFLCESRICNG